MVPAVYLDNAATTPVLPEVLEEMQPFFSESYGNPSSLHGLGRDSRKAIEDARERVARLLGAQSHEIVFTGGGTEADNLAIKGVAFSRRNEGKHIVTSSVEHHAVISTCKWLETQGFEVTYLPVNREGLVEISVLEEALRDDTILVSVMHANNEVGTIEPVAEIGGLLRQRGISLHTDAVQTFGHIPTNVDDLKIDLLSASGHKIYGPKGVGVLYVRHGTRIETVLHGGGQEGGLRSSTENVPCIVGFGKAAEMAGNEMNRRGRRILSLRERLSEYILGQIEDTRLNGHPNVRLPNNVNVIVKYIEGESAVLKLDERGVCASTGSACSSPSGEASHVLMAMGVPKQDLHSSLRLTLGIQNSREDIDFAFAALSEIVRDLREMSPLYRPS